MPDPFTIHLLTEAANTNPPCPGNAQCRCPTHNDRMHPTTPPQVKANCRQDPMICECAKHTAERVKVVRLGARESGRQPWQPRPARKAA